MKIRRKTFVKSLAIVLIVFLLGFILVNGYLNYFKSGIFLKEGLSSQDIKLTLTEGELHFYLFEKTINNKPVIGIMVLEQRNGFGWRKFREISISKIEGDISFVHILYPTIKNGNAIGKSMWGGVFPDAVSRNVHFKIDDDVIIPHLLLFNKSGPSYFFTESDNVTSSNLTIKNE
ncbi:hypothetical protein [Cohnella abietis]|uniref:Uncharacterized protein n=1 Tax=Cohnella abietis TaxID=2507935 RepID=A0A3T1D6X2_9BACL|nr:hypothetical protein [Cohnella abietis]BBI33815.1 hypothetical protein KCTCHS21_32140 [Cohnella abietis]